VKLPWLILGAISVIKNRDIKFRFWDKTDAEMEDCIRIDLPNSTIPAPGDAEGYIAMQFTGMTDSKGVDIYEGDILTDDFNAVVLFENGSFIVRNNHN